FFDNRAAVEVAIHKRRRPGVGRRIRASRPDDVSCDLCMSLREKFGSLLAPVGGLHAKAWRDA
ncbi:MAG TPA: hypothetical protein VKV18_00990, partial [Chthonomonas sp.]|uniref:hypothetical protein n=1 Tax=Chthonomonas sp. TaxID=2282153 RepID=UPI002B4B5A9B